MKNTTPPDLGRLARPAYFFFVAFLEDFLADFFADFLAGAFFFIATV